MASKNCFWCGRASYPSSDEGDWVCPYCGEDISTEFKPRILGVNGGYITYDLAKCSIDLSEDYRNAFVFTTLENCIQITKNLKFYNIFEYEKWQNPVWIKVDVIPY